MGGKGHLRQQRGVSFQDRMFNCICASCGTGRLDDLEILCADEVGD